MPTKLEPFYLSVVALYIKGTTQFMVFRKVSKNVAEALKMLHINPYGVVSYLPFLLTSLPNINTLYINALNAQIELKEDQLQQITWIDSSTHNSHLPNINKQISIKVSSLRFSAKVSLCQYLENFPNLQKLIIENAEYLNSIKVEYFKSLKVLKTLILYIDSYGRYTNDTEEMLDLLEKLLKENRYLTINIVSKFANYQNRVSDINFYHFPELFKQEKSVNKKPEPVIVNNDRMNTTDINEIVQNKDFDLVRDLEVSCQSFDGEDFDVSKSHLKTLKIKINRTNQLFVSIPFSLEEITIIAPNQNICVQTETPQMSFTICNFDCNVALCDKRRRIEKMQNFNLKNTRSFQIKSQKYIYNFGTEMKQLKVFNICCPFKELDFSTRQYNDCYSFNTPLFTVKDVGCCQKLILGRKTNILYYSNSAVDVIGKSYNFEINGKINKIFDYDNDFFEVENVESRTEFVVSNTKEKKSIFTEKVVIKKKIYIYIIVFKIDEYKRIIKDNELLQFLEKELLGYINYKTIMCDHILYPNSKEKLNTNLVQLNSECTCKIKEDEIVVFADLYQTRRFLDIIPKLKEPSKSEKIRRIEKAPKEDKFKYEEWRVEQKKPKACVGMYRGETTKEIKHSSIDDVLNEDWIDSDSTDDCEDVELEGLESYLYKE